MDLLFSNAGVIGEPDKGVHHTSEARAPHSFEHLRVKEYSSCTLSAKAGWSMPSRRRYSKCITGAAVQKAMS